MLVGSLLLLALAGEGIAAPPSAVESPPASRGQDEALRGAWLGREEAELRAEFGTSLKLQAIESRRVLNPAKVMVPSADSARAAAPKDDEPKKDGVVALTEPDVHAKDPFSGQQRLSRMPEAGDVQRVEYELFQGRVYRVRWQLAERFERPFMNSLVPHLSAKLGEPYYDQLIEGKFGTGRATLRRAGWRDGSRSLEVRQLNPHVGGPIFLTLSDQAVVRSIGESGGTAAPEPDSIGPWWQKPIQPFAPLAPPELEALLIAFDGVLGRADWERGGDEGDPP